MADQNKSSDGEDSGQASGDTGASDDTLSNPSSRNLSNLDNVEGHGARHVREPVDALAVATRPHSVPHTGVRHRQGSLQETPRQADQLQETNDNRANPCQERSLCTCISEFLNWFFYSPSFSSEYSPKNVLCAIVLTYILFICFLCYQDNKTKKSR